MAPEYGSFTDPRDGQTYKTVKIGNQIWMAENLNVDTFRNGDPIPEVESEYDWPKSARKGKPAWCYYYNDPDKVETCGSSTTGLQ